MSNSVRLYLTLLEDQPQTISYSLSPDRTEVVLGTSEDRMAGFRLPKMLHLGRFYTPQLCVYRRCYYLQATARPHHYRLVEDPKAGRLFGFSVLTPKLNWEQRANIQELHFENFDPGQASHYILSSRPQLNGPVVYSDPSNPDLTTTENGFGLRGEHVIYTYKISPNGKTVTVAATPNSLITDDLETNDIVRERYFYADQAPYMVGTDYPIYIWVNQEKRYLSNPQRLTENGPTNYELTSQPLDNTARLSPLAPANWREPTLTPNDFINLAFNNTPRLALWQDESLQGQPAVLPSTPPPALTSSPMAFTAVGETTTPPSIWQQWWFWLLVALALLLLVTLIVLLATRRKPAPIAPESISVITTTPGR